LVTQINPSSIKTIRRPKSKEEEEEEVSLPFSTAAK
jgi:hypothetical protein